MPHRGAKRIDEMEAMRGSVGNGKDMRGENGVEEEFLKDLKGWCQLPRPLKMDEALMAKRPKGEGLNWYSSQSEIPKKQEVTCQERPCGGCGKPTALKCQGCGRPNCLGCLLFVRNPDGSARLMCPLPR